VSPKITEWQNGYKILLGNSVVVTSGLVLKAIAVFVFMIYITYT